MIYRIVAEQVVDAPPETAYELVADVSRYPEFLAGLDVARIEGDRVAMTARVGPFTFTWVCTAVFEPHSSITTILREGPFRSLLGKWSFTPHDGKTKVTLELTVEPSVGPRFIEHLVIKALESHVEKSVRGFRRRVHELMAESPRTEAAFPELQGAT